MEKVTKAVEYMQGALSCSQAVMCAFSDEVGISFEDAKKISAPYAGGRKIKCGAVWGAELILQKKFGEENSEKFFAEFEKNFAEKTPNVRSFKLGRAHAIDK